MLYTISHAGQFKRTELCIFQFSVILCDHHSTHRHWEVLPRYLAAYSFKIAPEGDVVSLLA